jgi:excinuclease UvrABC ATPase subunit
VPLYAKHRRYHYRRAYSVTGVSGSGKSTLIKKIISCNAKKLDNAGEKAGQFSEMTGSFSFKAYRICRSKSYR